MIAFLLASMLWTSHGAQGADERATVEIVPKASGYQLLRNGQPYFICGVCGSSRLDELMAAGGNSIRTYGGAGRALDEAQQRGLTVLLGLGVGKPRQGFDYENPERVAQQLERARQDVVRFKDHPALLMWALGNESELDTSPTNRIRVWQAVNAMAEMVKQVDGRHPVITVLAGIGGNKLQELDGFCPALDAVGINTYGGMMSLPESVAKQGWKRPWLVTEYGPRGHWEVPKTAWGLPIEDSSTEKADLYLRAYRHAVTGQPACLGSYVFLWGQKQEKTHTWYGMFLPEGNRLGAVDAMTMAWTGQWPTNRCPQIGPGKIKVRVEGAQEHAVRVRRLRTSAQVHRLVRSRVNLPVAGAAQPRARNRGVPQRRPIGFLVSRLWRAHRGRCGGVWRPAPPREQDLERAISVGGSTGFSRLQHLYDRGSPEAIVAVLANGLGQLVGIRLDQLPALVGIHRRRPAALGARRIGTAQTRRLPRRRVAAAGGVAEAADKAAVRQGPS
jgi:hypothetical protein